VIIREHIIHRLAKVFNQTYKYNKYTKIIRKKFQNLKMCNRKSCILVFSTVILAFNGLLCLCFLCVPPGISL